MQEECTREFLERLETVFDWGEEFIPLHEPTFIGNEWEYVKSCLDSGWVSSVGAYVDKLEHDLQNYCGVAKAVATVNGTSALHTCLLLAGVMAECEVFCPSFSFVATTNAIAYTGATPHFVDCDAGSLGVDPAALRSYIECNCRSRGGHLYNKETGRKIAALVVVHIFGHPARLSELQQVCEEFGLVLIEDIAESLGSYFCDKHTGSIGLLSALSFNGNKIITTGGGGAVLTNDVELGERAKHVTSTARVRDKWNFFHDQIGYNYRMPNLNAALGCAQLEGIRGFVEKKRQLAEAYHSAFSSCEWGYIFKELSGHCSNYWLNTFILKEGNATLLHRLLNFLDDKRIMARPAWQPLHQLPMYEKCPKANLACTEDLFARIINLPSTPSLLGS